MLQLVPAGVGGDVGDLDGAPAPTVPGIDCHGSGFVSLVGSGTVKLCKCKSISSDVQKQVGYRQRTVS